MRNFLIIFSLLILLTAICVYDYSKLTFEQFDDNIFRLHILANSNDETDQNMKLNVRNQVLKYMQNVEVNNKEELIDWINEHKEDLEFVSGGTVSVERTHFPTTQYKSFKLPSGTYDSLQIKLGEAKGNNWWCVLYPSMCFIYLDDDSVISNDSMDILKENNIYFAAKSDIQFKFKVLEFFGNLRSEGLASK